MVGFPADITAVWLLTCVASLVNPKLGWVRKLLPTVLAGDNAAYGGQLVSWHALAMFSDDVVLQKTIFFATDGAQLPHTTVYRLMATQVIGLCEALSTGVTPVRSHVLVHQLVPRQVTEMIKALPTDVTNEGLVKVCHLVRLQHAGACVTFPTDVTVA